MKTPRFTKLTASRQIETLKQSAALATRLEKKGLARQDAEAVAMNASLVYCALAGKGRAKSPMAVLDMYSLEEIAGFCRVIDGIQSGAEEGKA